MGLEHPGAPVPASASRSFVRQAGAAIGSMPLRNNVPLTAACLRSRSETAAGTRCSLHRGSLAVREYHVHAADHSADQAHFYAVRVSGRIGENLVNNPLGEFPRTLIPFLYDLHPGSRGDVSPSSPVHLDSLNRVVERSSGLPIAMSRRCSWRLDPRQEYPSSPDLFVRLAVDEDLAILEKPILTDLPQPAVVATRVEERRLRVLG